MVSKGAAVIGVELEARHHDYVQSLVNGTSLLQSWGPGLIRSNAMEFDDDLIKSLKTVNELADDLRAEAEASKMENLVATTLKAGLDFFSKLGKRLVDGTPFLPNDVLKTAFSLAETVFAVGSTFMNPVAALFGTMLLSQLGGLLSFLDGPQPSPLEKLYETIMDNVKEMMDERGLAERLRSSLLSLQVMVRTLQLLPEVLSLGALGKDNQMCLMWWLMLQHDLSLLEAQLWGECWRDETSDECEAWSQQCSIFPALTLAELQLGSFTEIVMLDSVFAPHFAQKAKAYQERWARVGAAMYKTCRDVKCCGSPWDSSDETSRSEWYKLQKDTYDTLKVFVDKLTEDTRFKSLPMSLETSMENLEDRVYTRKVFDCTWKTDETWCSVSGTNFFLQSLRVGIGGERGGSDQIKYYKEVYLAYGKGETSSQWISREWNEEGWLMCPDDYYMRSIWHKTHEIEGVMKVACRRPFTYDSSWYHCYTEDITDKLKNEDVNDWVGCQQDYFITGLYFKAVTAWFQLGKNYINHLTHVRCCELQERFSSR